LVQKEALRKLRYVHVWRTDCGQNHKAEAYNEPFQNAEQFKYLVTTLTTENGMHDEIKGRRRAGNACYR
jgi:hypothetical protein